MGNTYLELTILFEGLIDYLGLLEQELLQTFESLVLMLNSFSW